MNTDKNNIIIEVLNLCKAYKKKNLEIIALNDINCSFNGGEFISIVGKSGSGKSTLLNMIGGLDKADQGKIHFEKEDLSKMNRNKMAEYRRKIVGMIFQSFNLIHHRTALGNIMLALAFGGVKRNNRKQKAIELLKKVGLENRIYHKPNELSGGEAQRVAIARALANQPKVLLADEPTGNLDSTTSQEIIKLLQDLNKDGLTIIMVTHDQETAGEISDRLIKLKDGKIIENKTFTK